MNKLVLIDYKLSGKKMREVRKAKGITVDELAEKMALEKTAIWNWERGDYMPKLENLFALSKFLGVHMDELLVEWKEE